MTANELRIGNYVEFEGQYVPVIAIDGEAELKELSYKGSVRLPQYLEGTRTPWIANGRWIAKCNPIPLTPEILVKCGFFKHNNAWVLSPPSSDWRVFQFSIWENMTYNTTELELNPPLAHLHQLQNLFYSLTGTELTVEL